MPEELTVKEAAERHGVTMSWLIRNLDQIQHRQIGPMYLLDAESVATWAANRKRRGGSKKGVPWSKQRQKVETSESAASLSRPLAEVVRKAKAPPPAPSPTETVIPIEGGQIRIDALQPSGGNWLHAEAIQGDVQAGIHLRRYVPGASAYTLDKSCDRLNASAPGRMGRNQKARAEALLAILEEHMLEALKAAGWEPAGRSPSGTELWHYRQKSEAKA